MLLYSRSGNDCDASPDCCGAGSGGLDPPYIISPLQGVLERAGPGVNVTYYPSPSGLTQYVTRHTRPLHARRLIPLPPTRRLSFSIHFSCVKALVRPSCHPSICVCGLRVCVCVCVPVYYVSCVPCCCSFRFYSASRGDHFLDFTCEECMDLYVTLRVEGYAYPASTSAASAPGLVELSLYYNVGMCPPYVFARACAHAVFTHRLCHPCSHILQPSCWPWVLSTRRLLLHPTTRICVASQFLCS